VKPDAKLLFYLERRHQIDEWCAIAKRFPKFAHDYFCSLGDAFDDLQAELGGDVQLAHQLTGSWPRFAFYREGWYDAQAQMSPITISFEWYRPRADFDTGYVGIRTEQKSHPAAPAIASAVRAAMAGSDPPFPLERPTSWWPAWHRVKPTSDRVWEDLDGQAVRIVDAVRSGWPVFASWVDAAFDQLEQHRQDA
jgi:hypothetical protein